MMTALLPHIVPTLHSKVAALGLVTAIVALTSAAAFAQAPRPYCTAKQHDCARTAVISTCCCGDEHVLWTSAAPLPPRVDVHADMTAASALPAFIHPLAMPTATTVAVVSSPPGSCLHDRPTLFVALLI